MIHLVSAFPPSCVFFAIGVIAVVACNPRGEQHRTLARYESGSLATDDFSAISVQRIHGGLPGIPLPQGRTVLLVNYQTNDSGQDSLRLEASAIAKLYMRQAARFGDSLLVIQQTILVGPPSLGGIKGNYWQFVITPTMREYAAQLAGDSSPDASNPPAVDKPQGAQ
jgi:hypothetical protein